MIFVFIISYVIQKNQNEKSQIPYERIQSGKNSFGENYKKKEKGNKDQSDIEEIKINEMKTILSKPSNYSATQEEFENK